MTNKPLKIPPSFQFYPKQWLGDDKVMLMDWDARAMHFHLICIAWQRTPPCTLPADESMIRRWVGQPSEEVWKRVWKQIVQAWRKGRGGMYVQSGLLAVYLKNVAYHKERASTGRQGAKKRWLGHSSGIKQPIAKNGFSSSSSSSLAVRQTSTPPPVSPKARIVQQDYVIPLPEQNPAAALVMLYKLLQGVPYNDRVWDKKWPRWMAKAIELLQIFDRDFKAAYACLKTKGEELTKANRTWTFNTIVDGAHLWKQQHGGQEYAHVNRERFLRDLIDQRKQKRMAELRRASTTIPDHDGRKNGDVPHDELHGPGRSVAVFPDSSAEDNGAGDLGHDRAVGRFPEEALEATPDHEGQGNGESGGGSEWGRDPDGPPEGA